MMEQDESIDFKTLRAAFQGENGLKIHTKPAIPEKPKTIPPSTKVSNPLISSINAAVKKGTLHAPRVIFKDDKNLNHQFSPPLGSSSKNNQSVNNTELLDNNQKKEVDTIKQNLKDKNLPLVLPVSPKKAGTPEPESSLLTPASASPIKWSTPKKFVFNPQKTGNDECEKRDPMQEVNVAKKSMKERNLPLVLPVAPKKAEIPEPEHSPYIPVSVPPAEVSIPYKSFVFTPQKNCKDESETPNPVKEVNTSKKSLKDRNLPLVLPVAPKKAESPEPEPSSYTPASISPINPSTPKNFVFTTPKTNKAENEKTDLVKEINPAKKSLKDRNLPLVLPVAPIKADTPEPEPSPYTPVSVSPIKLSTPKNFVFTTPNTSKHENEKKDTGESPTPACRTPAPSHPASAGQSVAYSSPTQSVTVIPKAVVPSQTSVGAPPVPNIPAPSIPVFGIPTSASTEPRIFEPKVAEPAIPTPVIPTQAVLKSKTGTSIPALSDTEPLKPNINNLSLSEVFPPPKESPPSEFIDIPPPVFDEDFPDGGFSVQAIPTPAIRTSIAPVPRCPDRGRLASPAQPTTPGMSTEPLMKPLENTPGLSSVTLSSPPPEVQTVAAPVNVVLDNAKVLTDKTAITPEKTNENQVASTSTKSLSAFSALARAEEMASVKRTPQDSRIFNLLERAKKKTRVSQLATTPEKPTTPESTTSVETATPETLLPESLTPLSESVTTDATQPYSTPPEKVLPQLAATAEELPEEPAPVPEVSDIPPVDYTDHTRFPPKIQPPEPSKVNGLDHRVLTVVKPVNPPPPPPRKALPATPSVDPPLEKPTQSPASNLQISTTPSEHLETRENSLHDSSFGEIYYEDAKEPEVPAVSTFRPPSLPSSASSPKRPISVHEEAFLKQLNPKHQMKEDVLPNVEDVDYGSVNFASPNPDSQAAVLQNSVQSSPALSPSGTIERGDNVFEDHADGKKGKTQKTKKQKGPPKNPYADTAAAVQEAPKKGLFSRKNSGKVTDEKEMKKKEKQREKEKEKEKEREKKEQKEKEKKENEMRKKFKITGQEEAIYQVKVIEDCKGRKNDLPVKVGDTVSIIRTVNCPKGKWLAKDSNNKYGYVPVESMDLNINGIMELGKMTTASSRSNGNGHKDAEANSISSRNSEHYGMNNENFSEDSEEWTCEDDDPAFDYPDETAHVGLNQSLATPAQHYVQENDSVYMNVQAKQEALQKLSTFFMQPRTPSQLPPQNNNPIASRMPEPEPAHEEDPENLNKAEEDFDASNLQILPPPDLYADIIAGDSMPIYSKPIKLVSK